MYSPSATARPGPGGAHLRAAIYSLLIAPMAIAGGQAAARPVARAVQPAPSAPAVYDSTFFNALRGRELGPPRGGRSVAAAGSEKRPL